MLDEWPNQITWNLPLNNIFSTLLRNKHFSRKDDKPVLHSASLMQQCDSWLNAFGFIYLYFFSSFVKKSKAFEDAALNCEKQMDTMMFSDILHAKGFID